MADAEIVLHRCTNIRVERTFVSNCNSITLQIEQRGGQTYEITLYDLPEEVTAKLAGLRYDGTLDFDDKEEADDERAPPPSAADGDAPWDAELNARAGES